MGPPPSCASDFLDLQGMDYSKHLSKDIGMITKQSPPKFCATSESWPLLHLCIFSSKVASLAPSHPCTPTGERKHTQQYCIPTSCQVHLILAGSSSTTLINTPDRAGCTSALVGVTLYSLPE